MHDDLRDFTELIPLLKNKRIFLTGGTGFFGKNLLGCFSRLNSGLNLGIGVTVLSRDAAGFKSRCPEFEYNSISFTDGDVRDFAFPRGTFDYVIHAATPASAKLEAENPDEMSSIIIDGTRRVAEFANSAGARRLLLTSSGAVYGVQPPDLKNIPEDFLTAAAPPVSAYGKGKLEAERICSDCFEGSVVARCFAFVGPYLPIDIHYAAGNFIRDGLAGRPIVIRGDGRPFRSYLYSGELVRWLLTILTKGEHGRAYNVGSETEVSIEGLARAVSGCLGGDIPVEIMEKPDLSAPPPRYVPSAARARNELGLTQKLSLKDSLRDTIAWHRVAKI